MNTRATTAREDDHVTLGARRRATAELRARDGVCDDDVDDVDGDGDVARDVVVVETDARNRETRDDDDDDGRGPREEGFHAAARDDDDETRRARDDARGGGRGGG